MESASTAFLSHPRETMWNVFLFVLFEVTFL
jgi:hypothetical protein